MKNLKLKIFLIFSLISILPQGFVFAIDCKNPKIVPCEASQCTLDDLVKLIRNLIEFITICLAFPIAVLMIVIGGIYFIISVGSPQRFETGKRVIMAVIIGLLIIGLAGALVNLFSK